MVRIGQRNAGQIFGSADAAGDGVAVRSEPLCDFGGGAAAVEVALDRVGVETRFRLPTCVSSSIYATGPYSLVGPSRTSSRLYRTLSRSAGGTPEASGRGDRRSRAR